MELDGSSTVVSGTMVEMKRSILSSAKSEKFVSKRSGVRIAGCVSHLIVVVRYLVEVSRSLKNESMLVKRKAEVDGSSMVRRHLI